MVELGSQKRVAGRIRGRADRRAGSHPDRATRVALADRATQVALALVLCLGSSSCALVGGGGSSCAPGLSPADAGPGAACLEELRVESAAVAGWLETSAAPDYVEVEAGEIRLLYIERDAVVVFGTGMFASSEPNVENRIRSADHMRLSDADRARLGAVRMRSVASPPPEEVPGGGVRRGRVGDAP